MTFGGCGYPLRMLAHRTNLSGMSATTSPMMSAPARERGVTSAQLGALSGLTYRQVDHHSRLGVLRTLNDVRRGAGGERRFSKREVLVASVLAQLLACGATNDALRQALPIIRAMPDDEWRGQVVVHVDGSVTRVQPFMHGWLVDLDMLTLSA